MGDNNINHGAYNAINLMLDTADNMTLSQLLFVYQSIEVKLRNKGVDTMTDYYYIVCLKRSKFADSNLFEYTSDWWKHCHIVYWKPNRAGYTYIESEAGLYNATDLSQVCGEGLDWMIYRVPRGD